ncbi:TolC family protein [Psychroflexus sp. CAK8W]|uniref:TolC family protein n=1 Tax=Psychroflexus longus TaxID=2873596 RepID=A0ABS7XHN9_9FLAO|nr:TolC family protein [Psychroflexus longus]MBZ9778466.1 TolC family protein [Psychroflexus longus]
MKKLILIFIFSSIVAQGQDVFSLDDCYDLAAENYPLVKQKTLLENQLSTETEVIDSEKLPQISLLSRASYQSDVINFPLPNSTLQGPNKDQYRNELQINQLIYGSGVIDAKSTLLQKTNQAEQLAVDIRLYQLKQRINQVYFSILLHQEKIELQARRNQQLQQQLREVKSGVDNGVIVASAQDAIQAELLKIQQETTGLEGNQQYLLKALSSLIGVKVSDVNQLHFSEIEITNKSSLQRPELNFFQAKKEELTANQNLISKETLPQLNAFANAGYSNPGLNMLDNQFQEYVFVGLQLNWKLFDWSANKNKRKSLDFKKEELSVEAETFQLKTRTELDEQLQKIKSLKQIIEDDDTIIQLRQKVMEATYSQLINGSITASTFLAEQTQFYESESSKLIHQIELMLAKQNYNTIKGY